MNRDSPDASRISETIYEEENVLSNTIENSEDIIVSSQTTNTDVLIGYIRCQPYCTKIFSNESDSAKNSQLRRAVEFIHEDKEFLVAAEIGNSKMLQILISKGVDPQQKDHLGRNALHLAVCADSKQAIILLLKAGVDTNVKDNVGMTPLSLCLMRRPSLEVANLLFDHGAKLLPRSNPVDTGLFMQFVMMCTPTDEEANILQLLTAKGALINDPEAPGGRQCLHFAAMSDNCPLIQILVDLGADLFMMNHRDETPKEVALTFKCRNAFFLLNDLEEAMEV